jgi:hypothetical protein
MRDRTLLEGRAMRRLLIVVGLGVGLLSGCGREAMQRGPEPVSSIVSRDASLVGAAQLFATQAPVTSLMPPLESDFRKVMQPPIL